MSKLLQNRNGTMTDITPTSYTQYHRNIGEIICSLVPLEDSGLHLLDGSLLSANGVYKEGIAKIVGLQAVYPNIFCTETEWQDSVSTYSVCGKFVYNETEGTLRLPKVSGFVEGTLDVTKLGDLVEAGLPNITGKMASYGWNNGSPSGCITSTNSGDNTCPTTGGNGTRLNTFTINASRSDPIYGNSATVQPQSIKGFVYMVLANTVKAPVVVDIDEVASDLNLKAGVDLANVNSTGQAAMAHAAMPSGQYIDLTLPASGSAITAPADGYVILRARASSTNIAVLRLVSTVQSSASMYNGNNALLVAFIPVQAGSNVYMDWSNVNIEYLRFVYANGSVPA